MRQQDGLKTASRRLDSDPWKEFRESEHDHYERARHSVRVLAYRSVEETLTLSYDVDDV